MRKIGYAVTAVLLAAVAALPDTRPGDDVLVLWETKQRARIEEVDKALDGVLGVATLDLTSGRAFAYNADAVFPTASSIKIPIMILVFRDVKAGKFSFADKVTLAAKDNAGGSWGALQTALDRGPVTLTVSDLVQDMIQYSDNSATNKLIGMVGMDRVNALLREFGMQKTQLRRKMMDLAAAARGDENISSPNEMIRIVRLILNNQAADADSCKEMLTVMKSVNAYMRPVIPDGIPVASKYGDLDGVRNETGIVFLPKRPFIVSVMSTYLNDRVNPVGQVTGIVFDYFNKIAHSNQFGRRID